MQCTVKFRNLACCEKLLNRFKRLLITEEIQLLNDNNEREKI